jgi:diguanylate cyclase (GGDEF)-like protein
MLAYQPQHVHTISEEDLAKEESRLNHLALFGGVAVTLVTVMALFLAMPMAEETWQYLMYSALGGVPLIHGMFSSFVLRRMHVIALHGYQSQLLTRISELQELVFRDELTGLHNRRRFYDVANDTVPKAFESKEPLAILLMDLDGLKSINDEHGHGVGDVVIATLGKILAKHIRGSDVAARLGGDEFGVIMPGTDKRGAFALARRLWEELESTPVHLDGAELMVTVSIGVAGYPWGGESLEEMLQWADADMYANKVSRRLPKHEIEDIAAELDPVLDDYAVGN